MKRQRERANLEKKHGPLSPAQISGRAVSTTFWGKAWCSHFEGMAVFSNRLPRGRTCARNGSVIHLEMGPGTVSAMVSGTDLYKVKMDIKPLPKEKWEDIKRKSAGQIGKITYHLKGRFPRDVMDIVCDPETGLFPLASEISFSCSCPDWACLCKHIGAVFYGIANRLDTSPELLFALRGADPSELLSVESLVGDGAAGPDDITEKDLSSVFGVEITGSEDDAGEAPRPKKGPGRVPLSASVLKPEKISGRTSGGNKGVRRGGQAAANEEPGRSGDALHEWPAEGGQGFCQSERLRARRAEAAAGAVGFGHGEGDRGEPTHPEALAGQRRGA
jgi:uncharacterized Zn finger protein